MEQKTKITADEGKQDLLITREFNLPVALLFKAHTEAEFIEQWMSNKFTSMKVRKLQSSKHGSWQYESVDPQGNIAFKAHGVIHDFVPNQKITRTFEMENTPFGVQLEIYLFEPLTSDTCKLTMHVVYESVEQRNQVLQLPFAQGINMAHNRIEEIMNQLK